VRGLDLAQAVRTSWSLSTLQEQTIIKKPGAWTLVGPRVDWLPASSRQVKAKRCFKRV
jgi:hypothetical protein